MPALVLCLKSQNHTTQFPRVWGNYFGEEGGGGVRQSRTNDFRHDAAPVQACPLNRETDRAVTDRASPFGSFSEMAAFLFSGSSITWKPPGARSIEPGTTRETTREPPDLLARGNPTVSRNQPIFLTRKNFSAFQMDVCDADVSVTAPMFTATNQPTEDANFPRNRCSLRKRR